MRAANGPCSAWLTDVLQALPALKLEPDDRQIQLIVFADGAERNRLVVDMRGARPIPGPYVYRYDRRDPRYRTSYNSGYSSTNRR